MTDEKEVQLSHAKVLRNCLRGHYGGLPVLVGDGAFSYPSGRATGGAGSADTSHEFTFVVVQSPGRTLPHIVVQPLEGVHEDGIARTQRSGSEAASVAPPPASPCTSS